MLKCKICGKFKLQGNVPADVFTKTKQQQLLDLHMQKYRDQYERAEIIFLEYINFFVQKNTEEEKLTFQPKLEKYAKMEIYIIMTKMLTLDRHQLNELSENLNDVNNKPDDFVDIISVKIITDNVKKKKKQHEKEWPPVMLYTMCRTYILDTIYSYLTRLRESLEFTMAFEFVINSLQFLLTYMFVYKVEEIVLKICFEKGIEHYTDEIRKLTKMKDEKFPPFPSPLPEYPGHPNSSWHLQVSPPPKKPPPPLPPQVPPPTPPGTPPPPSPRQNEIRQYYKKKWKAGTSRTWNTTIRIIRRIRKKGLYQGRSQSGKRIKFTRGKTTIYTTSKRGLEKSTPGCHPIHNNRKYLQGGTTI